MISPQGLTSIQFYTLFNALVYIQKYTTDILKFDVVSSVFNNNILNVCIRCTWFNTMYIIPNFLYHISIWLCHWSNTLLYKMVHWTGFRIWNENYQWAWLYLWLYSCGVLLKYFCGCHFYYFSPAFSDVLITNPTYV